MMPTITCNSGHYLVNTVQSYLHRVAMVECRVCKMAYPWSKIGFAYSVPTPKRLTWSAADKDGIKRIVSGYISMYRRRSTEVLRRKKWLDDLAYTLHNRRTHFPWRSFALLHSPADLDDLDSRMSAPIQVNLERTPRIGFVFTGQGAQWTGMGRELMCYESFKADILRAEGFLRGLGCRWSVTTELVRTEETSRVDDTEFSQTLCTVLQVALVNLLRRFGVKPSATLGHSSGEIAAAYAGGYFTLESAWKLAYFRGFCSAEMAEASRSGVPGSMISVGLSEEQAGELITTSQQDSFAFGISIACINSPRNVTLAGEQHIIDKIFTQLNKQAVFVRRLHVSLAYHSRQMDAIFDKYVAMIGSFLAPQEATVPMISTVTGQRITSSQLIEPSYWPLNMTSPVRFLQAVTNMCAQAHVVKKVDRSHIFACVVDHLLEVGPHAALQAPLRHILAAPRGRTIEYSSILRRNRSSIETLFTCMGDLYCRGAAVDLEAVNKPSEFGERQSSPELLVDLPEYPFDHSQSYWHESRLSRNYRFRENGPSKLLGVPARDWSPSDARWRHYLRWRMMSYPSPCSYDDHIKLL
ncbi:acyl transferase domain-containing protein [Biscogniauxia mediterranea]|nr:acyl transferase domain-containing protein [Biscogniauxia mediterranea]